METVQAWFLAWFAVGQALVAFAVWQHRDRWGEGAVWISALFAVNGIATGLSLVASIVASAPLEFVAQMVDRVTNPLLLLVAAAPILSGAWRIGTAAIAFTTVGIGIAAEALRLSWGAGVSELPLLVAMVTTGIMIPRMARHSGPLAMRWTLLLAVLGMRFVELGIHSFVGPLLLTPQPPLWHSAVRIGSAAMVVVGGLAVVPQVVREDASPVLRVSAALLLAGAGLGLLRLSVFAALVPALVFLTLGLVRPIVVYVATHSFVGQAQRNDLLWNSGVGYTLAAVAVSALGLVFSSFVPDATVPIRLAFAGAFAAVGLPIYALVQLGRPRGSHAITTAVGAALAGSGSTTDLNLLAEAPHWQRLLLALLSAPDDPRAFERTTPGLQQATGCPHASVGAELRRCNRRASEIRHGLAPTAPEGHLVLRTWGSASGLRSHRAARYSLTPTGRMVAEALRERLGPPHGPGDGSLLRPAGV